MKKIALTVLTAITCTSAGLSPAYAENLLQVYQHAKQFDPQLKAQESSYLAITENKPQALAGKKPQVSLSASSSYTLQNTLYDTDSSSNSFNTNYTLGVTKSLYNKTLDAQIDQTEASITQAKANLESQRQSLILRVARAYFNVLLAQETVGFAAAEKKATQRQLAQVQAYFDAGRSAITDVKEAESRYNQAIAQEVSAREQVNVSLEGLRVLTGRNYQHLDKARGNLPLTIPPPKNINAWVKTALQKNKTLLTQKQAIETARRSIDVQRAGRKPVVSAYARHTGSITDGDSALDPRVLGASVGVEMSIPLYQGGSTASKVRQAQHNFRQAKQQYDYQAQLTEQQTRTAYLVIESDISQIRANQRALNSAQTALKATQAGFEVGTRTSVDVMTSLRDVFQARSNLASSRYNYLYNTLSLKQAAGTLTARDLAAMGKLLSVRQR